jgi:uncharacterized protein (DUF1778 family)
MAIRAETLNGAKTVRLDLKTTEFAKEFIRKAAAISGLDMTSFILASAFEKAEAVMETYQRVELTEKAFARAHEIVRNSEERCEPNENLVKLLNMHSERNVPDLRAGKPE